MTFSRKFVLAGCIATVGTVGLRAELQHWLQHLDSASTLEAILFRTVTLPAGPVKSRKPPREAVAALEAPIKAAPLEAGLYRLRSQEAEQALDFARAEADLQRYAQLATDKFEANIALADYYQRRLEPAKELRALLAAAALPSKDTTRVWLEQASWKTFVRALASANAQALPAQPIYAAWMARYATEPAAYMMAFDAAVADGRLQDAESILAAYQKQFAADSAWPVLARARIERQQGGIDRALTAYERTFQPLMPPALVAEWFRLLGESRNLRKFLADQRAAVAANPSDLTPAVKLFYYWQQQNNLEQAHRALLEFEQRKISLGADELFTLARLFEETRNYVESARLFGKLSSRATLQDSERGLAGLIRVLLTAPEMPIRIGAGDLSYWKDIATMDPYPGTLNGVLSLLFNTTYPASRFAQQDQASTAYFHRAKAAELMASFDQKFPNSADRPVLHAKLIEAYAIHGDDDGVIRRGRQYLASFPKASERGTVALGIADAHARKKQITEELAVYAALLDELAAVSGNVPLGEATANVPEDEGNPLRASNAARNPQYARVLDRYIGRLVAAKRVRDALAVYRTQITKNPNDPGLYARLAVFLDQNKLALELEQTYQQAMQQFQDRSWSHKLARWYLRTKRVQEFAKLTRDVTTTFSGTELESYFAQVAGKGAVDANLYLQLNLYAHQRFPHDLVFVRNLLDAYRTPGTQNPAAWEGLIRQHWYYDGGLRNRFFEFLSSSGRLESEVRALQALVAPAKSDRAATQFLAEARAWRGAFEDAAPPFKLLAADYPAEQSLGLRASALHRSLGDLQTSVDIAGRLSSSAPRDTMLLARVGEIYADRERFAEAKPWWNKIAPVDPGTAAGYLESATVFWDYFLYDEALGKLREGRTKLKDPALFAFEVGAILENKRQYADAVNEYVRGASAGQAAALSRLLRLARMPAHRDLVESATRQLAASTDPPLDAFGLRIAVLENQGRTAELQQLLRNTAGKTGSWELLTRIDEAATRQGFDDVRESSLERQVALTNDPVEKTRLRIQLARFLEDKGEQSRARQTIEAVLRDNSQILGVVRAATEYFWRNRNAKEAIDTLERAASSANQEYKRRFTLEAASKASLAGDYRRARGLLTPYLEAEPLSAELITAMADTYAREGDNTRLREFYLEKIAAAGRTEQAATLRRSLIPVLARVQDHAAATEQYIQLMNRYPEDAGLLNEAAAYARQRGTVAQLTAFYQKAASDSPRDARWPVILARIYTATEAPDQALALYTRAVTLRPERKELWAERARLEERLLKFNEAAVTYAKLYDLSYRAPMYMLHVAENRVRLGQTEAAVQALRTAFLENRAVRAQDLFEVALRLESWNLAPQAREFAEQGLAKITPNVPESTSDLRVYIRIATRLRNHETAYAAVSRLAEENSKASILGEMAAVARQYFTPEEKAALAAYLRKLQAQQPKLDLSGIAAAAGLADVEAAFLAEQLRTGPQQQVRFSILPRLIDVQKRRMRFDELANQIEAYWKTYPESDDKDQILQLAADAFRLGGSYNNELRVLSVMEANGRLAGPLVQRLNFLLRTQAPARLVMFAEKGRSKEVRNNAVATALEGADAALALKAVAARGIGLPPVWTKAYTALTGLHYSKNDSQIAGAFTGALGSQVISDQLGKQVDRSQQLAGDNWFYYGGRYGEYLRLTGNASGSEDYVPAELEGRPASAAAYVRVAEYYARQKDPDKALADFEHALQFDAGRPDVHISMAELQWARGQQPAARQHLRLALQTLSQQQDSGRVPESYWRDARAAIEALGRYQTVSELRNEANSLLKTYVRRNGTYRAEPLIRAVVAIDGVRWVGELARFASDPVAFLESFANSSWLTPAQRVDLYARMYDLAQEKVAASRGEAFEQASSARQRILLEYADVLLTAKLAAKAEALLNSISAQDRARFRDQLVAIEVRLASATNTLPAMLALYSVADAPPSLDTLRNAAIAMRLSRDSAGAARVLEYVYEQELKQVYPPFASTFLGLAEAKLRQGDATSAISLLRRMTLAAPEGFEPLGAAALLLERFQKHQEAIEFRQRLAQAVPWDRANLVSLAALSKNPSKLEELARSADTPYASRVVAASSTQSSADLASGELNFLSRGGADEAEAEKPYFHAARMRAAEKSSDNAARFRLLRGALEIDPRNDTPRLPLFRAALAINRNQGAVSIWEPVLAQGSWGRQLVQFRAGDEYEPELRYSAGDFLSIQEERATIARELAGAYRRLSYLPAAHMLLRLSYYLEPSPATTSELASVEAEQRARALNTERAPVIRETVDQERPVKPRLELSGGVQ